MLIVTRNNPESHPMLRRLLERSSTPDSIQNVFFGNIYISETNDSSEVIVFDDPLAFLYGYVFLNTRGRHLRLWALEMWSHQVAAKSLRLQSRRLVFWVAELFSYLLAQSIIFPSESRMSFLSKRYPCFALSKKSKVVHNVPIFSEPVPQLDLARQEKVSRFRGSVERVVIYAGSLQKGRLLEEIVFCGNWGPSVGLLICGSGSLESDIRRAEEDNSAICYLGALTQSELAYVYSVADIGVLSYSNDVLNTKLCAPVKLWEYLHYDLKIIGNDNYGLRKDWGEYIDGFYTNTSQIVSTASEVRLDNSRKVVPDFKIADICGLS